jgi:hypothetical protein
VRADQPEITLEVTVESLQDGPRQSFYFEHEGTRCYCFDVESSLGLRRLAMGQRVGIRGRWSPALQHVFEAVNISLLP